MVNPNFREHDFVGSVICNIYATRDKILTFNNRSSICSTNSERAHYLLRKCMCIYIYIHTHTYICISIYMHMYIDRYSVLGFQCFLKQLPCSVLEETQSMHTLWELGTKQTTNQFSISFSEDNQERRKQKAFEVQQCIK